MKTEAEIGGMWPQAKEHQQPPAAGRGKELTPPYSLWRECGQDNTLVLAL